MDKTNRNIQVKQYSETELMIEFRSGSYLEQQYYVVPGENIMGLIEDWIWFGDLPKGNYRTEVK